ncbi:MAG: hypothetical protein A4E28_00763 [Methanocella sp. PtaU1.Bin125]|nr:MAG: hypothetical protein A4E28_00763 [Methanocella sp. PtaU1.Bin125]
MKPGAKEADSIEVLSQDSAAGGRLPVIMECTLFYSLSDRDGTQAGSGEANARLDAESLAVAPAAGEPLTVSLRDIVGLSTADYRMIITLASGHQLTFSRMGRACDDFTRLAGSARAEVLLKEMLLQEKMLKGGVNGQYQLLNGGVESGKGPCEVRVYATGLVLLPFGGDPVRIPLSWISAVADQDYRLTVDTERGERIVLSMLGREFDPLKKALSDAMNDLGARSQAAVRELLPLADSAAVWRVAKLMKDGRAARRADFDAISPKLWPDLEKRLESAGMGKEYAALKAMARQDRMCLGYKKGLVEGDEYLWLLAPVYGEGGKPGNAIIMEATRVNREDEPQDDQAEAPVEPAEAPAGGEGKATYVFRIVGRKEYPGMSQEALDAAADAAIRRINDCMLAINFRREPIYLPDETLQKPAYVHYLFSVQRLPELRALRALFVGRAIHANEEKWRNDLDSVLAFNVRAPDDAAKWSRGLKL